MTNEHLKISLSPTYGTGLENLSAAICPAGSCSRIYLAAEDPVWIGYRSGYWQVALLIFKTKTKRRRCSLHFPMRSDITQGTILAIFLSWIISSFAMNAVCVEAEFPEGGFGFFDFFWGDTGCWRDLEGYF